MVPKEDSERRVVPDSSASVLDGWFNDITVLDHLCDIEHR